MCEYTWGQLYKKLRHSIKLVVPCYSEADKCGKGSLKFWLFLNETVPEEL